MSSPKTHRARLSEVYKSHHVCELIGVYGHNLAIEDGSKEITLDGYDLMTLDKFKILSLYERNNSGIKMERAKPRITMFGKFALRHIRLDVDSDGNFAVTKLPLDSSNQTQ